MPSAAELDILFSDEDADLRELRYSLDDDGYARRTVNRKPLTPYHEKPHLVVAKRMFGDYDKRTFLVDHENRNKRDNRRSNLRLATRSVNMTNRPGRSASGTKNLYFHSRRRVWLWQFGWLGIAYQGASKVKETAIAELTAKKLEVGYVDYDLTGNSRSLECASL